MKSNFQHVVTLTTITRYSLNGRGTKSTHTVIYNHFDTLFLLKQNFQVRNQMLPEVCETFTLEH